MMILMLILWAVWVILLVISFIVHHRVEHDFRNYPEVKFGNGINGCDVVEKMLKDNYIYTVHVQESKGLLTDYYNPFSKTLCLSHNVYHGKGVQSIAVALRECGHALQHDRRKGWAIIRSVIVPIVNFLNKMVSWVLIIGSLLAMIYFIVVLTGGRLFGLNVEGLYNGTCFILLVGLLLYGLTIVLALLMLPIENRASSSAMDWVNTNSIVPNESIPCVERVLHRASKTYLLNVLTSMTDALSKLWDGITWVWFWLT